MPMILVKREFSRLVVCVAAVALTTACAGGEAPDPLVSTVVVTATSTPTATPTPTESTTAPEPSPLPSIEETGGGEVPESRKGQFLGLNDFFEPSSEWLEDRVDVGSSKGVMALFVPIYSCGGSATEELELRLGNKFSELQFMAGQDNGSKSSEQVLLVEVRANGRQVDIQRVPFNKVMSFKVDVEDVNALKINMSMDREVPRCGGDGGINASVWDIRVD